MEQQVSFLKNVNQNLSSSLSEMATPELVKAFTILEDSRMKEKKKFIILIT